MAAVRLVHEKAAAFASQATAVGDVLLDAIRYDASFDSSEGVRRAGQDGRDDDKGAK
jgi:hypothetical protein